MSFLYKKYYSYFERSLFNTSLTNNVPLKSAKSAANEYRVAFICPSVFPILSSTNFVKLSYKVNLFSPLPSPLTTVALTPSFVLAKLIAFARNYLTPIPPCLKCQRSIFVM
ncbi:MAG: hypothetical protein QM528_05250 [Phycisphaerales bacterium]|nr:hypothetical protein [Phycisphaerales bacterium]